MFQNTRVWSKTINNLYIIKLHKDNYTILHPVLVPLMDVERIKLKLDTKHAKLPGYTKYIPYLAIWLPRKDYQIMQQKMYQKASVRRTELL